MLLIALVSPLLMRPAPPAPPPMQWAASVGIARIEAQRKGQPMLAVYTPGGRGGWMSQMLSHPRIRGLASRFVNVKVEAPSDFVHLVPNASAPPFSQFVFASPDGRVVKRLSGMLRIADLEQCLRQVEDALKPATAPQTPEDKARWAVRTAMGGNVAAATEALSGIARTASAATRAEAFGAIGDELRAEGLSEEAVEPLETAVSLSQTPSQVARWTVRLALNRARIGDRAMAVQELLAGSRRTGLSQEERDEMNELAYRIGNGPMMGMGGRR